MIDVTRGSNGGTRGSLGADKKEEDDAYRDGSADKDATGDLSVRHVGQASKGNIRGLGGTVQRVKDAIRRRATNPKSGASKGKLKVSIGGASRKSH